MIKTHLNMTLNEKESNSLMKGKDNVGIKSNSEYIRFLINKGAVVEKSVSFKGEE